MYIQQNSVCCKIPVFWYTFCLLSDEGFMWLLRPSLIDDNPVLKSHDIAHEFTESLSGAVFMFCMAWSFEGFIFYFSASWCWNTTFFPGQLKLPSGNRNSVFPSVLICRKWKMGKCAYLTFLTYKSSLAMYFPYWFSYWIFR